MRKLILIKHAAPQVVPTEPPEKWHLSDRGRGSCALLAEKLAAHHPQIILSSLEAKAIETAQLVAAHLKVPVHTRPNLHEHDRSNVPHMRSGEFISMIELLFRKPDERVLGKETATQALERFSVAVDKIIAEESAETLAIVSHGTVIALYLAEHTGQSGFQLWRDLGLPSFAVLELPEHRIIDTVTSVNS